MRNLLKQTQRRLFYRALIQRYTEGEYQNHTNKTTPNEAKTVALLFDATTSENRKTMDDFAQKLKNAGKKVAILGFYNDKVAPQGLAFRYFNKKNVDWKGIPFGDEIQGFLSEKYDLLYDCSLGEHLSLEWLAALAHARFKIGPAIHDWIHYDLIVGGKFKNLNHFIEQAAFHAAKITKSHALSAV